MSNADAKWIAVNSAYIVVLFLFSLGDSCHMKKLEKRIERLESHRAMPSPSLSAPVEPKLKGEPSE